MGLQYSPIQWNKYKKQYDIFLWAFIAAYLGLFFLVNQSLYPQLIPATTLIRGFGSLAFILLHIILMIGPLCRLDKRFLPLLYNRRHLGVTMFLIASVHVIASMLWFHGSGNVHPLVSLFGGNTRYGSFRFFPFQTLGFAAYIILMFMAFTSHDFWLAYLSPKVWKSLHMLVYAAYSLLIMHVALGVIQLESSPILFVLLISGLLIVSIFHLLAGYREWKIDSIHSASADADWQYVCDISSIEEKRAKITILNGERVAVFKYDGQLSAIHNVCKHQHGPLGEGKIVDGCVTCPWHGYQYKPEDGRAPLPFHEKVATYQLKTDGKKVYIHAKILPEGTYVEPLKIRDGAPSREDGAANPFFIGWSGSRFRGVLKPVRNLSFAFGAFGLLTGVIFASNQKHIAHSSFDYERLKSFNGRLVEQPFPGLRTLQADGIIKTYPLINNNKFGADGLIGEIKKEFRSDEFMTTVTGALLERDGTQAIELSNEKASIKVSADRIHLQSPALIKIADTILRGEIIDPKCYLGAMNPGEGKPHRSCAILCISGGIMPMLSFKGAKREVMYAVLLGPNGERINQEVLDAVAEPVKLTGSLYRFDNWYILKIDPKKGIERLYR